MRKWFDGVWKGGYYIQVTTMREKSPGEYRTQNTGHRGEVEVRRAKRFWEIIFFVVRGRFKVSQKV